MEESSSGPLIVSSPNSGGEHEGAGCYLVWLRASRERQPARPDLWSPDFACAAMLPPYALLPLAWFLSGSLSAAGIYVLHATCQLVPKLMNLCSLPGDKPGKVQKETKHKLQRNRISSQLMPLCTFPVPLALHKQKPLGPGSQEGWTHPTLEQLALRVCIFSLGESREPSLSQALTRPELPIPFFTT